MNPQISSWIQSFLAADPPRSKSLVVTIFGDSIAPHGGAAWLGSLIELLAPFGVNERLVRSSVFRLAEEGWIEAERHGRRSEYRLTASGSKRFEQAYRKIYVRPSSSWDGHWTIVFAGLGTVDGDRRTSLRRELLWEGFRPLSPLTFARPGGNSDALLEILERTNTRKQVVVCNAREPERFFARPLSSLIAKRWNLNPIGSAYRRFIRSFQKLAELLASTEALDPEQSFVVRTLLIHAFRRVLLHDPLLPVELLPDSWRGNDAYELCRSIYRLACPGAEQHLLNVLGREGTEPSAAADYFYERFGGLTRQCRSGESTVDRTIAFQIQPPA